MIERWRPETHTFYLPINEATIALQDVEVLFGLAVDGLPVALLHAIREYMGFDYLQMLQRFTVFQLVEETALSGATRLQLTPVWQYLGAMDGDIADDTPDLLLDWQMCRESIGTLRDVARFLPLLQIWAWERFLQFQPPLPPIVPDAPPLPFLPLARRWVDRRGYRREVEARHNLPYYRDLLDFLEGAQFIWRPYNDKLIACFPDYCSSGRVMWSSSVPLMCLDIVEHHATERVLRQFGRLQLVPTPPAWLRTHY
uniref:Serine/threonine-protein phosphatase 7 long form homolog n=1 Tax=Nicotiana tabacum TaxID=4097 RepID=A0A1S3ZRN2_TOBAC|nr:PREDICTED: serine/threonine-protein phosphatase 7 long form homolog [Nicotiana tabacum]